MAPDQTKQAEVVAATDVAEQEMRPQTVPVNVYETDAALVIVAPLPAVQPEDVMIDVTPGQVRITAALRSAAPRDYIVHEWFYGGVGGGGGSPPPRGAGGGAPPPHPPPP